MCKGQQLLWGLSPGDYKTVALKQNTDRLNDFDAFPGRAAKGSIIRRQSHLAYSHTLLESSFLTVSLDPPITAEGSLKGFFQRP
ncbi:alpha-(1,3)-fucosyltransferase 7 isoform X3 [Hypanus sabinus]|uniref:alpha-(1,3)-fucosyltransferase 7 isoform X3 n=1 Tax=Hypanus sabinus TaxID=79690 RepID=UPI0028C45DFC|nr:alpha-(1,3)-fucosyltransferase 7 isoform X3 [Hypanus sabinus]